MFPPIQIFVTGEPKGQPRPRAFARNGMVRMYDPATAEGWKAAIADEWRRNASGHQKTSQPVCLTLCFFMPRPKSHFNSKGVLKPSAPKYYAKKPDADNMAKAVMDCLTQLQAWDDDDQVVILKVVKQFEHSGLLGCDIMLKEAEPI